MIIEIYIYIYIIGNWWHIIYKGYFVKIIVFLALLLNEEEEPPK